MALPFQNARLSGQGPIGGVGMTSSVLPRAGSAQATNRLQTFQPQQGQMQTQGVAEPQFQTLQPQQPQPRFGLSGAEQALQSGLGAGISALEQGQRAGLGSLQQGQQALSGNFGASARQVDQNTGQPLFQQAAAGVGAFSPAGLQAQGLQSALSGAQGQEAFNQAFINSPVQQFIREQGEQSRINQAAATGGVGGGAIQQELTRFGQGLAGTQLQQQIQNLGALSGQGLQAAGQQGQFLSQAGQQQGQLASTNAQLGTQANIASAANRLGAARGQASLFGQGAGLQFGAGQDAARLFSGTGQNLAQGRTQAGRDIAQQIGGTTSALANLRNQQGGGLSDIIGQGGSNLANLLSGSGQMNAQQQTQLAQLLSNLAVNEGSQISGAQQQIGQAQAGGHLGASNAVSGLLGQGLGVAALGGGFDKGGIFGNFFRG